MNRIKTKNATKARENEEKQNARPKTNIENYENNEKYLADPVNPIKS